MWFQCCVHLTEVYGNLSIEMNQALCTQASRDNVLAPLLTERALSSVRLFRLLAVPSSYITIITTIFNDLPKHFNTRYLVKLYHTLLPWDSGWKWKESLRTNCSHDTTNNWGLSPFSGPIHFFDSICNWNIKILCLREAKVTIALSVFYALCIKDTLAMFVTCKGICKKCSSGSALHVGKDWMT